MIKIDFSCPAAEYEVRGIVSQKIYSLKGSLRQTTNQFTIYVRDCGWLVQTIENDGSNGFQREVGSTNGVDIFEASLNRYFASSTGIPVELLDEGIDGHLWLMFASQCYWGSQQSDRLTPVFDWHASVGAYPELKVSAKWDLLNGAGSLPREVLYLGEWGETNGLYTATGTNSIGGILIPGGFVFEERHFGPLITNSFVHEMTLRKRVEAVVTSVHAGCSRKDLIPKIGTAGAVLIDWRLREPSSGNHIPTYRLQTNQSWPTIDEAKQILKTKEIAEARHAAKLLSRNRTVNHPKIVFILMSIFVVAPPIFYFWGHKTRQS